MNVYAEEVLPKKALCTSGEREREIAAFFIVQPRWRTRRIFLSSQETPRVESFSAFEYTGVRRQPRRIDREPHGARRHERNDIRAS